jgi:phage shock protein C
MSTRQRPRKPSETEYDPLVGDVTDEDVELYLAEQAAEEEEKTQKKEGFINLQTGSGLALIGLGLVYLLQQLGIFPLGYPLEALVQMLPWLAGVLIVLTGFGVLSWSPARRRRKAREEAARKRRQAQAKRAQGRTMGRGGYDAERAKRMAEDALREAGAVGARAFEQVQKAIDSSSARRSAAGRTAEGRGRRLTKSKRDRKVFGVCAGIARYLGIDPIVVRILFVVGTFASAGWAIALYAVLGYVMPTADPEDPEEEDPLVRITRD